MTFRIFASDLTIKMWFIYTSVKQGGVEEDKYINTCYIAYSVFAIAIFLP